MALCEYEYLGLSLSLGSTYENAMTIVNSMKLSGLESGESA